MKSLFYILLATLSIVFLFIILSSVGERYNNKDIHNNIIHDSRSIFKLIKWKLFNKKSNTQWPKHVDVKQLDPSLITQTNTNLKVSYITHSTFLIQNNNINIITDPVLFSSIGIFEKYLKVDLVHSPGIKPNDLPKIDYVLISHNHYDHLDKKSIIFLRNKFNPVFIMGKGNCKYLKNILHKCVEMQWNERFTITKDNKSIDIFYLRAKHWSKRGLFDTNKTLWGAFAMISDNAKLYFAGDTAYHDHFKEAQEKFEYFDIALLPIGSYEPEWFMKEHHLSPSQSILTHRDLKAKISIPMHYKSIKLSDEGYYKPIFDLKNAIETNNIDEKEFLILDIGEVYEKKD